MTSLISIDEAKARIERGDALTIAGDESALRQLPKGLWIGGTIPYFMAQSGGCKTKDLVMVNDLSVSGIVELRTYTPDKLSQLMRDAPDNGWTVVIMPYGGKAHETFANNCRDDAEAFIKPVVGWVSGVDLDFLGKQSPKVFMGPTGEVLEDGAVAAHGTLADGQLAMVDIVNIFEPDRLDVVRFPQTGFKATDCTVNGEPTKIAEFLKARGNGDGKLPLVGDFAGTYGNAAIQAINFETGEVGFYAPVFPDVEYWIAKPVGDYASAFRARLTELEAQPVVFSCNCAVNYLYGELEGKQLGTIEGPVTFGEVGYQLLSQTLVALRIL
jgi:hypothetical protein